ncbi:hypothetical protein PISMIDRAFT_677370 [Pisolithus microcarpus 441]|uniref:Uncharacterized protein n=1 Tax=Pisolithus microcarpus 441 TaxID=765257 RepID=A0A0C9Z795_9AGAM|nr:hypothetical protein PISMIDRAFT_677370 [Pisolithus microcarpus 441]
MPPLTPARQDIRKGNQHAVVLEFLQPRTVAMRRFVLSVGAINEIIKASSRNAKFPIFCHDEDTSSE